MRKRTTANPHPLLDHLIERWGFKNDAELGRHLGVSPPVISKMRHGTLPVSDSFRVKVMERCLMTLDQVREAAGEAAYQTNLRRSGIYLLFIMRSDGPDGPLLGNGGLGDLAAVSDDPQYLEDMHAHMTSNFSEDRKDGLIVDYDSLEVQCINRREVDGYGNARRCWKTPSSLIYANAQSRAAILELQRLVKERG